jgi:hypothetical protein
MKIYTDSFLINEIYMRLFLSSQSRTWGIWVNPWVVWWVEGAQKDELAETELMVASTIAEEPGKKGIPHNYSNHEILQIFLISKIKTENRWLEILGGMPILSALGFLVSRFR